MSAAGAGHMADVETRHLPLLPLLRQLPLLEKVGVGTSVSLQQQMSVLSQKQTSESASTLITQHRHPESTISLSLGL